MVNLDKHEFVSPHKLGSGLKLWEQLANHPGTGAALIILCAAMPEARGGGDFDLDSNWHGPERTFPKHNCTPGPMPRGYQAIAQAIIGRWAGDRIALVGDYAENDDMPLEYDAGTIYSRCNGQNVVTIETMTQVFDRRPDPHNTADYHDISDLVARVIEHELNGKYVGDGWKEFKFNHQGD